MQHRHQLFAGLALIVLCSVGCRERSGFKLRPARKGTVQAIGQTMSVHAPKIATAIEFDGELDEPVWRDCAARTGAFRRQDRSSAVPHSEARFLWREGQLLVALYASDIDLETRHADGEGLWQDEDAFQVELTAAKRSYTLRVSPNKRLVDATCPEGLSACDSAQLDFAWQSGAKFGVDLDGTLNQPRDFDEEWVVELAIPFASLGLSGTAGDRIGIAIHRCDVPAKSADACGSWGTSPAATLLLDRPCITD